MARSSSISGCSTDDRVLVVNIGAPIGERTLSQRVAINESVAAYRAIQLHSWRQRAVEGDQRKQRGHPIHMHGFYFRVDSRGSPENTTYAPESRRLAVTEDMQPATTMSMMWSPDRPGNWLLHCHLTFHVTAASRLDGENDEHAIHATDPMKHMAGLVVGINVKPRAGAQAVESANWNAPSVRRLRLFATERPRAGRTPLAMSYVLQRDGRPPAADSVEPPGQPIVLTRGELTEITIVNRAHDGTAVHWHGIELESYSDGVRLEWRASSHLCGTEQIRSPRAMTLQRAGTFIYHTHLNDVEQLTSGMYGPIIVLIRRTVDPSRDHVSLSAGRIDSPTGISSQRVRLDPLVSDSATHRFRFVKSVRRFCLRFDQA